MVQVRRAGHACRERARCGAAARVCCPQCAGASHTAARMAVMQLGSIYIIESKRKYSEGASSLT